MRYEGDKPNYNWNKHIARFQLYQDTIRMASLDGHATDLSEADEATYFLSSIPADCTNRELVVAKGVCQTDRARYKNLWQDIIPVLTPRVTPLLTGEKAGRSRNISQVGSRGSGNRSGSGGQGKGGRGGNSGGRSGPGKKEPKAKISNGQVVGELEAMRYPPNYWNLFTDAQKQQVAELRRRASQNRQVAAATTGGNSVPQEAIEAASRQIAAAAMNSIREASRDRASTARSNSRGRERDSHYDRDDRDRGNNERHVRPRRDDDGWGRRDERARSPDHSGRRGNDRRP